MSKILIIYAHPHKEGHNGLILKNVIKILEEKNQEYEVLDLYEMKFDPVMKKCEHLTQKNRHDRPDIIKIQKKIDVTEKMIFIFPVWWNNTPAILKGFFDRVFSTGYAYKYVKILPGLYGPRPLLKNKKAAVIITTGSLKLIFWFMQGRRAAKSVCADTLTFCGIKSKYFQYDMARKLNERAQKKIPKIARRAVKWLL